MSKQHAAPPERDEAFGKEYIGNIWGKKFTLWGALLIIFMSGIMFCEHKRTGTESGFEQQKHSIDRVFDKDSL